MRSKQDLAAKADALVSLIRKYGGWVEGDMVHFPSVHLRERFEAAMTAQRITGDVFYHIDHTKLEQE